jgi:hypothetical protein
MPKLFKNPEVSPHAADRKAERLCQMDRSPNSFDEVQVGGISRIADRTAEPWQRQQRLQRWKTHMQRLGQALANGNLGQAQYEFDALVNDGPDVGQADPMAHPQFTFLGRALQSQNLAAAREAFSRLENEAPSLHHRPHLPEERSAQDAAGADIASADATPGTLDVTA